ncbi:hypothetical protein GNI_076350, partial [Gregarina niphandrodes]
MSEGSDIPSIIESIPAPPKKKKGIMKSIGHALFGKKKKKAASPSFGTADASVSGQAMTDYTSEDGGRDTDGEDDYRNDYQKDYHRDDLYQNVYQDGGLRFDRPEQGMFAGDSRSPMFGQEGSPLSERVFSGRSTSGHPQFAEGAPEGTALGRSSLGQTSFGQASLAGEGAPPIGQTPLEAIYDDDQLLDNRDHLQGPLFNVDQPISIKDAKKKSGSSGWFKGGSGSKSKEKKKAEKRLQYLQQARADVNAAEVYGLSSDAVVLASPELIQAEEQRKVNALVTETKEGFLRAINEFTKAVYAKHGRHCMWKAEMIKVKHNVLSNNQATALLQHVVDNTWAQRQESEEIVAAIDIYTKLAKGESCTIDWKVLSFDDAASLAKIHMLKDQLENFVHRIFDEDAAVKTLAHTCAKLNFDAAVAVGYEPLSANAAGTIDWGPTTTPGELVDGRYAAERGLPDLRDYANLRDGLTFTQKVDVVLDKVVQMAQESALRQSNLLSADLERLYRDMTEKISNCLDYIVTRQGRGSITAAPFNSLEFKLGTNYALHQPSINLPGYSPSSSDALFNKKGASNDETTQLIRRVALRSRPSGKCATGLAVSFVTQEFSDFDQWLNDSLRWQTVDLSLSKSVRDGQTRLEAVAREKAGYLKASVQEKLALLWSVGEIRIKQEALDAVVEQIEALASFGGPGSVGVKQTDYERETMAREDALGTMRQVWVAQYKDYVAKHGGFKTSLKTEQDVRQMHEVISELYQTLCRDGTVIEDLELQGALDSLEQEVKHASQKLSQLKKSRQSEETSIRKQLSSAQTKRDALSAQVEEEEKKLADMEEQKRQGLRIQEEVDDLKEKIEDAKQRYKDLKQEMKAGKLLHRDTSELDVLRKELSRQENNINKELDRHSLTGGSERHKGKWFGGLFEKKPKSGSLSAKNLSAHNLSARGLGPSGLAPSDLGQPELREELFASRVASAQEGFLKDDDASSPDLYYLPSGSASLPPKGSSAVDGHSPGSRALERSPLRPAPDRHVPRPMGSPPDSSEMATSGSVLLPGLAGSQPGGSQPGGSQPGGSQPGGSQQAEGVLRDPPHSQRPEYPDLTSPEERLGSKYEETRSLQEQKRWQSYEEAPLSRRRSLEDGSTKKKAKSKWLARLGLVGPGSLKEHPDGGSSVSKAERKEMERREKEQE